MMDEQNLYDYLDGKLTGHSLKDFESQLKEDQDLQQELATLKEMKRFLNEDAHEEEAVQSMKTFHKSYLEQNELELAKPIQQMENDGIQTTRRKLLYLIPVSIAAIVLAGFFLKSLFQTQNSYTSDEIFAAHFNPTKPSFGQKGVGEGKDLLIAEQSFIIKDFTRAAEHFTSYIDGNPANYEAILYRAISYIALGNMDSARTDLDLIRSNRLFEPAANLYDALIHIKEQNNDQAISLLNKIPQTSSFYKEAKKILEKLQM